jgi:lysophospholipase L1-like esterase
VFLALILSHVYAGAKSNVPRDKKVLIVGDSLIWGYTEANEASRFLELLRADLSSGFHTIALGHPGMKLREIYSLVSKQAFEPDLVMIEAGSDDILQDYAPNRFETQVMQSFGEISKRYPKSKLIVANVPDLALMSVASQQLGPNVRSANQIIQDVASALQANVLDLFTFSKTVLLKRSDVLSEDGLHPNAKGQGLLASFVATSIDVACRS